MAYDVDYVTISTRGLESSPVASALAGLRANEARFFRNKYHHVFVTHPAEQRPEIVAYVAGILKNERDITVASPALEVSHLHVEGIRWTHVFYESGLSVNVLYTLEGDAPKRAVGIKLSEGMDEPAEFSAFKYARQKSTLAGIMRGTFFVIKGEYPEPGR